MQAPKAASVEYQVGLWSYGAAQVLRERDTGLLRVCKVVTKARLQGNSAGVITRLRQLQGFRHAHLSNIIEVIEDSHNIFIISEKLDGGDVADWMDRLMDGFHIHENTCALYMRQVLLALQHAHEHGVYHGDLSPSSILLTSKMPDAEVRVADMGIADILDPQRVVAQSSDNPYYAPEARAGMLTGRNRASQASQDLWAAGALAHALLLGRPPSDAVQGLRARLISRNREEEEDWTERSEASRDFVEQLLRYEADQRPTVALALQHRWLGIHMPLGIAPTPGGADTQQGLLCYMLAVLLAPVLVPHGDFERLRLSFQQADVDQDGLVPRRILQGLLRRRCVVDEAVAVALEIVDLRKLDTMDLCGTACADLMAREFFASGPTSQPLACPLTVAELLPRMLRRFFEVYGDRRQPPVSVHGLAQRLRTATARDVEAHAGVRYHEVLATFDEDGLLDSRSLAEQLSAAGGHGTPLVPQGPSYELVATGSRASRSLWGDTSETHHEGLDFVGTLLKSCGVGLARCDGGSRRPKAGGC
eukprot:CAMPEP_0170605424 /NCGR_PEP_ID=MMETSP0224-20130122/19967_1 /TAXON_ID=285029 /ORGANISM="Togula jolla, Strain CCCM 725" /LENGTH=532 /DNA_ID=CAMNT_0010930429 /DNA_START=64 /DNA_END=1662 /DNA_ORIENTATION=+